MQSKNFFTIVIFWDKTGELWFRVRNGKQICLHPKRSRPTPEPTHTPVELITRVLSRRVKLTIIVIIIIIIIIIITAIELSLGGSRSLHQYRQNK